MSITINIYYTGENGDAKKFANEMTSSGIVDSIRSEEGNLRYEYFFPIDNDNTILLIDSWKNQESLDTHHDSPMMSKIMELRNKYNLTVRAERYISDNDSITEKDKNFITNE